MNALLLEKIKSASPAKADELKTMFHQSPLMLRFVEFLEKQPKENFTTSEAVCFVYEIKKNDRNYSVYENRFYKLRKKLREILRENVAVAYVQLPLEQQQMNEARLLADSGKFKEAQTLLEKVGKQCWQNNVFEILPEVLDNLIQINQALNTIEKNKPLHKTYLLAVSLYADLMEAKNIVRQIYEVNMQKGFSATEPLYNRLAKLVVKHRAYPRFKLLYNFVSAYYKIGASGQEYIQQTHVINRHIAVAKQIMRTHPDIPWVYYTHNFQATQYYRLNEMQAMSYFNSLRFKEAAQVMFELYKKVTEKKSRFNSMKNEILFTNTIHILINAARYDDAQQVVEDYKNFVTENRLHERLTTVYYEAANVHSAMYPAKSKYEADFLLKQLDKYSALTKKETHHLGQSRLLKLRLLLSEHRFTEAAKELKLLNLKPLFSLKEIESLTHKVVQSQLEKFSETQLFSLKNEIKKQRLSSVLPGDFNWLVFLEKLMSNNLEHTII